MQNLSFNYHYILSYNYSVDHSKEELIQGYSQVTVDSLIELYLLSKCDIFEKTLYSSFGNTSQLIGGHL